MSAPLTLITGTPGAGKTLWTIDHVRRKAEKESRLVFYSGVPGLTLPWCDIDDGFVVDGKDFKGAEQWFECPPNSIIVIDECQRVFRPRGVGSKVPKYVEALETLRHKGFDLFMITQHPMLIDSNVRRLVGRHVHVSRRFGLQRSLVLEFPSVRENPRAALNDAVKTEWRYPKEVYKLYKSADAHTIKARVPMQVYLFFALLLVLPLLGWTAYNRWTARGAEQVKAEETGRAPARTVSRPNAPSEFFASAAPRIAGFPHTAPKYDEVTKPVVAPYPAGCYSTANRCRCFTQQGTRLPMTTDQCRAVIAGGGIFIDWEQKDVLPAEQKPKDKPTEKNELAMADLASAPVPSAPIEAETSPNLRQAFRGKPGSLEPRLNPF